MTKTTIDTYIPSLIEDGFTKNESIQKLRKIFKDAQRSIKNVNSQEELENDLRQFSEFSLLPGILSLAPFKLDLGQLMHNLAAEEYISEYMLKPVLRYFEIWKDEVGVGRMESILLKIVHDINRFHDPYDSPFKLALYFDKLINRLPKGSPVIEIGAQIITRHKELPALLSFVPVDKLPQGIDFDRFGIELEPDVRSTKVHPIRHHRYGVGVCPDLDDYHHQTFVELGDTPFKTDVEGLFEKETCLGNTTLIYLDDVLVGAMKATGDPSILGLKNVMDAKGRMCMVVGGTYATHYDISSATYRALEEGGKFACLDVDKLPLYPLRMIDPGQTSIEATLPEYIEMIKDVRKMFD